MVFKYFNVFKGLRQVYTKPDEFVADASIGFIGKFFFLIVISLLSISGIFLFIGFYYNFFLFKLLGFLSIFFLFLIFLLFRKIKKMIRRTTRDMKNVVSKKIKYRSESTIVNVDIKK